MTSEFTEKRLLTPVEAAQLAHDVLSRAQRALHHGGPAAFPTGLRRDRRVGAWLECAAIATCGLVAVAGYLIQR